jgi:hypothetical protein
LLNRYRVGEDGKTAEKKRCGRDWHKPALSFGEKVYVKPVGEKKRKNDLEHRMVEGRYVGHHGRTGAITILTKDGVVRGASFRRQTDADRWNAEGLDEVRGFPWNLKPEARNTEAPIIQESASAPPPPIAMPMELPPKAQRRRYVLRADVEKYGPTDECIACTRIVLGEKTKEPHTEACRKRMEQLMAEDDAGRVRLEEHRRKQRGEVQGGVREPDLDNSASIPTQVEGDMHVEGDELESKPIEQTETSEAQQRGLRRQHE